MSDLMLERHLTEYGEESYWISHGDPRERRFLCGVYPSADHWIDKSWDIGREIARQISGEIASTLTPSIKANVISRLAAAEGRS